MKNRVLTILAVCCLWVYPLILAQAGTDTSSSSQVGTDTSPSSQVGTDTSSSSHVGTDTSSGLNWHFAGYSKYQFNYTGYPANSVFNEALGDSSLDNNVNLRLKFSATGDYLDFKADYQFIALYADTLELSRDFPAAAIPLNRLISDDRRWWDLTHSIKDQGKQAVIQRLDRLNIGFTGEKTVWRFGRQAISWGNGMLFTPMDIFNPFDPAAVDKEYKPGDDMLYGQYLFNSGNDLQMVAVVRRNPHNGNVESEQSSLAVKYHGFIGMNEYDLLLAEHYGDPLLGLGGNVNIGGAVWRGDLTWAESGQGGTLSLVTSISWSWLWGGKNVSGLLEYYYNGFGQDNGNYSTSELAGNPELLKRIGRGELFSLGRNYLATSVTIEISPLFMLIPNVFVNLEDPSALLQLVGRYDWKQNLQLLAAINIPLGSNGSEYGGIPAALEDKYLSTNPGVFAQLAWYF